MEVFKNNKKVKFGPEEDDLETNEGKARRRKRSPIVKRMEMLVVNAKLFQSEFQGKRQPKFIPRRQSSSLVEKHTSVEEVESGAEKAK